MHAEGTVGAKAAGRTLVCLRMERSGPGCSDGKGEASHGAPCSPGPSLTCVPRAVRAHGGCKQESLISVCRSSLSGFPVEYHLLDAKEQGGLGEARDAR